MRARRVPLAALACLGLCVSVSGCAGSAEPSTPTECAAGFSTADDGLCLQDSVGSGLSVYEGDLVLESSAALEEFCADYNAVLGDLTVRIADASDLAGLACLRKVGGHVRLDDMPDLVHLSLPWLDEVSGDLNVQGNPALETLDLGGLEVVGGGVALQFLPSLGELSLPVLQSSGGFLAIYKTNAVSIDLPELVTVGAEEWHAEDVLYIRLNGSLEQVSMPKLRWIAGVLKISSNAVMEEVSMPSLEAIGAGAYISFSVGFRELTLHPTEVGGFLYLQHSHLRRFSMPCLEVVQGDLAFNFNESLEVFHLPRLTTVQGTLNVQQNPILPGNQVQSLVEQIQTGPMGTPMVGNNGPDGGEPEEAPPCSHD